jgi:hypothetical protein
MWKQYLSIKRGLIRLLWGLILHESISSISMHLCGLRYTPSDFHPYFPLHWEVESSANFGWKIMSLMCGREISLGTQLYCISESIRSSKSFVKGFFPFHTFPCPHSLGQDHCLIQFGLLSQIS